MNTVTTQSKLGNALIHGLEINGKSIVQLRDSDGFVNLTFMCKAGGKRSAHYLENKQTTAFIEALEEETGIPASVLIEVRQGNHTWAHPDVGIHCASWNSPKFGIAVNKLVRKFLSGELKTVESKVAKNLIREHIGTSSSTATGSLIGLTEQEKFEIIRPKTIESIKERQTSMRDRIPGLTPKHFAQINNFQNQLILGFDTTTAKFKKTHKLNPNKPLAEIMRASQLGARNLFDLMFSEKLQTKQITTIKELFALTHETIGELSLVCQNIRTIGI